MTAAATGLGAFLRWWGGELAALAPPTLRRAIAGRSAQLIARPAAPGGATLTMAQRGRLKPLGALDALPRAALRGMARAARRGGLSVALAVPSARIATRRVALPAAAERDAEAALALDLDRLTPFGADELFWGWRIAARGPQPDRIAVDVTFTPRAQWAPTLEALAAAGLPAHGVMIWDGDDAAADPADAMTLHGLSRPAARGASFGRRAALAGCAALALLGLWHAGAAHWRLRAELAALGPAVQRARAAAFAGAGPQADPLGARLGEARATTPLAVATLDALSAALPDDAWVSQLTLAEGRLSLQGEAAEAARLIPLLEAADAFAAPRFEAPLQRIDDGARERFVISLSVAPALAPGEADAP